MITLNLETKNKQEEIIKEYLENNVSQTLADKINNGVKLVKEDKSLINKKTLSGFIKYACDEARKQAEKGANSACVEDNVVFGWAIHYFEEDSIEEKLYNEDGTEYKVEIKKTTTKVDNKPKPKKQENNQPNLFDLMNLDNTQQEETEPTNEELEEPPIEYDIDEKDNDIDDFTEDEIEQSLEEVSKEIKVHKYYQIYHEQETSYPDIVILTRLGDFYEAFNENAKRIADVLNLTLTSKDVGLENRVALAGFPVHVKESYIQRLQKQYTVLVIENEELSFYEQQKTEIESTKQCYIDKYYMKMLYTVLDGKLLVK